MRIVQDIKLFENANSGASREVDTYNCDLAILDINGTNQDASIYIATKGIDTGEFNRIISSFDSVTYQIRYTIETDGMYYIPIEGLSVIKITINSAGSAYDSISGSIRLVNTQE